MTHSIQTKLFLHHHGWTLLFIPSTQLQASPAASCFPVRMGDTGARTQLYLSEETSDDRQRGCFPHVGRRFCKEKVGDSGVRRNSISVSPKIKAMSSLSLCLSLSLSPSLLFGRSCVIDMLTWAVWRGNVTVMAHWIQVHQALFLNTGKTCGGAPTPLRTPPQNPTCLSSVQKCRIKI